jgi:NADH:ubiquinone oxidoreductase subunit 2 (subunit N)
MVTAAVAAYFYLRVAVLMYAGGGLGEPEAGVEPEAGEAVPASEPVPANESASAAVLAGDGATSASSAAAWTAVTTLNEEILLADEEPQRAEALPEVVPVPVLSGVAIWVCVGVTVLFGVWPQPLIDFANHATLLFLPK